MKKLLAAFLLSISFIFLTGSTAKAVDPATSHCQVYYEGGDNFIYENASTQSITNLTFLNSSPEDIVSCQGGIVGDGTCAYPSGGFPANSARQVRQLKSFDSIICTFADGSQENASLIDGPTLPFPGTSMPTLLTMPGNTTLTDGYYFATAYFIDYDTGLFSGTVDYGDGSEPQNLNFSRNNIYLDHQYQANGKYRVLITINDDDQGFITTGVVYVTVDAPQPASHCSFYRTGNTFFYTNTGNTDIAILTFQNALSEDIISCQNGQVGSGTCSYWPGNFPPLATREVVQSQEFSDVTCHFADGTQSLATRTPDPNSPPTLDLIQAPTDPIPLGTSVDASAIFTDPDELDTHTATWDWGDGTTSAGTINKDESNSNISGQHTYAETGVYTINLTLTDASGESATAQPFEYVVVYDPSAGFVTGGGFINSPIGAYQPKPDLSGKATFGFVSRYKKGANVPTGQTQFRFQADEFVFESTSYQWLVIGGSKAKYKGSGTVNGTGNYSFLLSVVDGKLDDSGEDKFRIKIWNDDGVVYDNQIGESEDAEPSTIIDGGSIVIHK